MSCGSCTRSLEPAQVAADHQFAHFGVVRVLHGHGLCRESVTGRQRQHLVGVGAPLLASQILNEIAPGQFLQSEFSGSGVQIQHRSAIGLVSKVYCDHHIPEFSSEARAHITCLWLTAPPRKRSARIHRWSKKTPDACRLCRQ